MPTARMNRSSSALRLAATGWLVSRQCTSSAPSSSAPVGSVPGIKLESAQNAFRWLPVGKRNGQATNPGFSLRLGRSARHATSVPDTKDWRKKFARSATRDANLRCDRFGGNRRRLTQVAPATAASPTGRSVNPHPEIMSQKVRKSAARTAAARGKPTETVSDGVFNAGIQDRKRPATRGAGRGRPAHAHRLMGSASAISSLSAATRQSYHVHSDGESAGLPRVIGKPINAWAMSGETALIEAPLALWSAAPLTGCAICRLDKIRRGPQ
jgi:hypothetical protein